MSCQLKYLIRFFLKFGFKLFPVLVCFYLFIDFDFLDPKENKSVPLAGLL